jgi:ribose/xylose/arabinose/galactoside ABC-type transport system permease subunit
VGALAVVSTGSPAAGVVAGMAAGLLCGLVNGLIITIGRVNTIIATLATLSAFRGLAFIIAPEGKPVGVINPAFNAIGTGRVALTAAVGIPVPLLILLVVAVLVHVFLSYSDVGRAVYAMGGNPIAARLAGINLRRMTVGIYLLSGTVAGLAGIVVTARTFSGQPQSGTDGLELEAITAAFLGGCAIQGGKGTIAGTLLAVFLIGTLSNGMSLLGMPTFYQLVAKGLLLVLAVAIQQWRLARAERARTSLAGRAPTAVT